MDAGFLAFLDHQQALPVFGRLEGWSTQRFLAEKMVIIVSYFSSEVLKFILGGRNFGQVQATADREWQHCSGLWQARRVSRQICAGLTTPQA